MRRLVTIICLLLISGTARTGLVHVPGDSSTIQAAIHGAIDGDTVLVAPGRYAENISFLGKGIVVASTYIIAGDTTAIDSTVIAGETPLSPDSGSVVAFASGEDSSSVLIGFTITGGLGTVSPWDTGTRIGGGILCLGEVSPIIAHNRISGNELAGDSSSGAGIGVYGTADNSSLTHPTVIGNVIDNNSASGGGIAIDIRRASALIAGNVISHNSGRATAGGAIQLFRANAVIIDNTIAANALNCIGIPSDSVVCSLLVRDNILQRVDTLSSPRYAIANSGATSFEMLAHNCIHGSFTDYFVAIPQPGVLDTVYTNANGDRCDGLFNLYRDPAFCRQADFTVIDTSVCIGAASDTTAIGAGETACYAYFGPVWHVDTLGNDTTGDGTDPYPFRTIQRAVDACAEGDTVLIHDGTYAGEGNTEIQFGALNRVVMSEHGQGATVIDGEGGTVRCLLIEGGQDTTTVIQGLQFINADIGLWISSSPRFRNLHVTGHQLGIYVLSGEPSIDSCHISGNVRGVSLENESNITVRNSAFVEDSVGLLCTGGAAADLSVCTVTDCTTGLAAEYDHSSVICVGCEFTDNGSAIEAFHGVAEAIVDSSLFTGNGVAILGACDLTNSTVRDGRSGIAKMFLHCAKVTGCVLENLDTALVGLGAKAVERDLRYHTPGFHLAHTLIRGCREAGILSGGTDGDQEFLELDTCRIEGNSGGIAAEYCGLSMIDCLYVGNGSPLSLRIRLEQAWSTEIIGCTFARNLGDALRLTYYEGLGTTLHHTLIAHNGGIGLQYTGPESQVSVGCCDVFGNLGGDVSGLDIFSGSDNNISLDPLFCDTTSGDYSVYSLSPCAPTNNDCGVRIGASDADCPPPLVTRLTVDSLESNRHVVSDNPLIAWSYADATGRAQLRSEVAVGTDSDWTVAEMWAPEPIESADTVVVYGGDSLVDGQTYVLRLRLHNGVVWSEWNVTSFSTNTCPSEPVALSPVDSQVTGGTPTLWVGNCHDPEGDVLTYDFSGIADSGCAAGVPIDVSGVPEAADSTGALVDLTAAENCRYWWRARAFDGYEHSQWSLYSVFAVDGVSESPTTPVLMYPPDTAHRPVYDLLPEFVWSVATDPDPGDTVRYRLEVAVDSSFLFVARIDSLLVTDLQFPDSLDFHTPYWWRVTAFDTSDLYAVSDVRDFWMWTLGDLDYDHMATTGDLTIMIDHLFITLNPLVPMKAGDLDGDCIVTMGDLTILIDHLYITLSPLTIPGCD